VPMHSVRSGFAPVLKVNTDTTVLTQRTKYIVAISES